MKTKWIYIIGVFVFGLGHEFLQSTLGNAVFFVSGVLFLIALSLFADKFGK